eukprot:CAMPEP_0182537040 /NCGR_PEP_ID=MMETSP1323-20130603/21236_1 /TAXON_ID=236787 /ORGANISM="Florenciella parvula, Strain RCC1693" /LENGTH=51 /DNA_ID=CAMNT_0024747363 /DNA_START=1 /DNA_END=152 /DNA_ORIENTATION=-
MEEIGQLFHRQQRDRKSRFVQVGQDMVLKENNYEVTASSYDFGEAGSASGG